ncbi:hypothetical protein F4781DRAFT_247455 [Annulohypoxylon bovei var. microspora]|nr:hypothetical protein F4781DRAFT_247455 [Annulohypoxylon bovei var. microspora]
MSSSSPTVIPNTQVTATYTNSKSASDSSSSSSSSPSPSSTAPFTLATPLTLPDSDSSADKTSYLKTLRGAVSALQERVNSELTARMEEEAREIAAASKGASVGGIDEAAEEENYGEEVVEDEE